MKKESNKKLAFTLAEVLITLAIISVVAAMTIPNLISSYKEKEVISRLKQAYALANNAQKLSIIDNGPMEYWNVSTNADVFINTYFKPYFKNASLCRTYQECGFDKQNPYLGSFGDERGMLVAQKNLRLPLRLANGMFFIIAVAHGGENDSIVRNTAIELDINGANKPNRICQDLFSFNIQSNGVFPTGCFKTIFDNGWKIPDNYATRYGIEKF